VPPRPPGSEPGQPRRYDRPVRLSDTLTGDLVDLPESPAPVGMYVCGPTVYARAHIGNARPYVVFSWMARWLRERGHAVTLVHNITDVNDKIYDAAPGRSAERAAEATAWYLADVAGFGLDEVTHYPKVTDTIDEIVAFIGELLESGHAYAVDGDVYFRVASYADYGRLSRQRPDQVEGQEPNALKEDPRDFALWKANKPGEDTAWDAPWGRGRPGWHIECSAMAEKLLGPEFWIHGGGLDLVFPHHENERAQSCSVGRPFARIWAHNGLLRFTGEKMSKSVGNIATIEEVLDEWGRETTLLFFLTAHWRKPIDFSVETMTAAQAQAESFRNAFRVQASPPQTDPVPPWSTFVDTLEADFNTPEALAIMHGWRTSGHLELLRGALALFGLEGLAEDETAGVAVQALAQARVEARVAKNFAEADRLRAEIAAAGWEVRDVASEPGYQLVPLPTEST
jgi:cysteinyl-tRNA synthetase